MLQLDYVEGAVGNVSTVIDTIKIVIFLPNKWIWSPEEKPGLRYRFWKPLPQGDLFIYLFLKLRVFFTQGGGWRKACTGSEPVIRLRGRIQPLRPTEEEP